ncbi:fibronectin-like [Oncorhynchus tshawytscha]|uniref:fibronectin-like n=1 Tax=Oncorhynchus tshawytscha TaxID=74940 RepID=UPI001C3E0FF0|nr:fibronectin-like [Oncorhynchus tshawytscha]
MSCYGDQHTMLSSDDVLPPPGDFQVLLLTLDSVSLSWSSPQGLTGPQTFRVTWGCDGETSSTRVKDVYHLEISSLKPGEKYQFSVATEGEDGRQSRWVSASLSTVVPPRDLKIDHLEETSFTLHWSKAEGMEKVPQRFLISYCIPGTDPLAAVTDDCHKTFSNLHPGTEYTVSVATVLSNGEQSEPVSTTVCTILPAPDQLTVDLVDTTSAAVSWSQPPGLDQTQHHYQISYHCPRTKPHITTTSSHSITLSDLKPATQYSVTVCTVLDNGKQSQLVSTTLTTVLPAPDQLTVDLVDTTSAAVSWSQPPGLDQTQHHYQISYHCPRTKPHITTTSSHSITLSDLKPATQYSVTVCTVLDNGKQSQLVSTTLTTEHFQWWKRPSTVAAVFVLLAVIMGLWDSYATSERDQLQNSLNTRTTERDQLQNILNTRTTERDQLQNILNTRTTERDQLQTRLKFYEKPCLDGWWKFGTSCYFLSSTMKGAASGQKECRTMGADLVIINSKEEQIFIHGFKKNVWIGTYKKDRIWKWVDDTPFKPTYWMEGEPNNFHGECVEISQTASDPLKSWKDGPCTTPKHWVCEKPFTP